MDYRLILSVLLIAHFLGDFYFQSDAMATNKHTKFLTMILHGLIYAGCVIALTYLLFWNVSWLFPAMISALHLIIDFVKGRLLQCKCVIKHPTRLFFADQAFHIATIVVIAYFYAIGRGIACSPLSLQLREAYASSHVGLPAHKLIHIACIFLFVGKPAGIITAKILETVRINSDPNSKKEQILEAITGEIAGKAVNLQFQHSTIEGKSIADQRQKAGRYIGILERYLTVIFFLLGQYTAIAFTLTAKSIARFKELEKADFAEQYLIGTLVSQLLAIISTVILCG